MPRKTKTNILAEDGQDNILKEVYKDAFTVKNIGLKILNEIAKTIDYNNKEEVLYTLPLVEKQMEIINTANNMLLEIEDRINGKGA